jgi:hypothetical protein
MARREEIERYVTEQTGQTYPELLKRASEGRLVAELSTEETVAILVRAVRTLYEVDCWLADELDKIEAAIPTR